ncbi:predicted protein [Arabidopsis lyrata subsp. lyrata]|uniref:Predicted protein n=1 Tax=Arabidopsis lyrata subsp. lyrata TaxID=81972 RepID=D7KRU2_ARALL|nr:predicted protein [Arabidopsis lyrata subsp. lyrata]
MVSAFVHVTNQQFILHISSSGKITDPDKPSSSTSPLPLNNPSADMKEHLPLISSTSDDLNEHLPWMSSPSRSNRAASNPSDSLRLSPVNSSPSRSQTTETAQIAGSPTALFGPDPPEVHDNIPSDFVPSPRSKTTDEGDGSTANLGPDPPEDQNNLPSDPVNLSRDCVSPQDIPAEYSPALLPPRFQSHTATHNFPLSFQLLALHTIPLLERYLPDLKDEQTFTDRSVLQLTQLKTYHNSNIFQTENDPLVDVESIIHTDDGDDLQNYSWSDEVEDMAVDIIWNKLKDGHCFNKSDWHSAPIPRKQGTKKQGTKIGDIPTTSKTREAEMVPGIPVTVDLSTAEGLLREVDRRNHEHTPKIEEMWRIERAVYKDEIVDEVLSILREKSVYRDSDNLSHTDLMAKMNKSKKFDLTPDLSTILKDVSVSCKKTYIPHTTYR